MAGQSPTRTPTRPTAPAGAVELKGSRREKPPGRRLRETAAGLSLQVQVYLKPGRLPGVRGRAPTTTLSRDELRSRRASQLEKPFRTVERFASEHGLTVVRREPERRMIRLAGSVAALKKAFGAELHDYREGDRGFRARTGSLLLDKAMARVVEAVLGFSNRSIASPSLGALGAVPAGEGHPPNAFAALYEFPTTTSRGKGERIALVQLGGQYYPADTVDAFSEMGIAAPTVVPLSVAGTVQSPDTQYDREIALDVQVAGAIAPNATLLLYFATQGLAGMVDAIGHAIHDNVHNPTIVSISYGAIEDRWTPDLVGTLSAALIDAAHLGVTVIAAAGDFLATGGFEDGAAHVYYPASDPYVLGCGGTTLVSAGGRTQEAVWNDGQGNGTGGGVSSLCPIPDYQSQLSLPLHATSNKPGRGVPDCAAIADGAVGYKIRVAGAWRSENGTSGAAPLWAGLIALINAERGRSAGFINPRLYEASSAFNDVTQGDNRSDGIGYLASQGWDACTGLGTPRGGELMRAFQAAGSA